MLREGNFLPLSFGGKLSDVVVKRHSPFHPTNGLLQSRSKSRMGYEFLLPQGSSVIRV